MGISVLDIFEHNQHHATKFWVLKPAWTQLKAFPETLPCVAPEDLPTTGP